MDARPILAASLLLAACATAGKAVGPRPMMSLAEIISNDDYPAAALRREEEGTVGFRLVVSPEGRVSDCTITLSSGSASLDAATCRLLSARARFHPALDRKGHPVPGGVTARIVWRIQKDPPPPPIA